MSWVFVVASLPFPFFRLSSGCPSYKILELIHPNKTAENHPREIDLDHQEEITWEIVAIAKGKTPIVVR